MADPHSTRRKPKSSSRPQNRAATTVARAQRYKTSSSPRWAKRPSSHALRAGDSKLLPQLREIAQRLRVIYSSCVTTQLALQKQNADQDHDILCALRTNVSESVSRQVERLDALVVDLGRSAS
jgi:hypothetical protein